MRLIDYANNKKFTEEFLKTLGITENKQGYLQTPYYENEKAWKENRPSFCRIRKNDSRWMNPPGSSLILYGLWRNENMPANTNYIILTEGESDAQTCWFAGFPALGLPGALTFKEEYLDTLGKYENVFLCLDQDEAGKKGLNKISGIIADKNLKSKVYTVRLPNGIKDISDLFAKKHFGDKESFIKELTKLMSSFNELRIDYLGWDNEENLTSTYRDTPVEEVFKRVNGAELKSADPVNLPFLPFLGEDGYIVRDWSHVISGAPKAGKTELVTRLIQSWNNDKILYLTEEPMGIWQERVQRLEGDFSHVNFVSPLGLSPEQLLVGIEQGEETVVIVDTLRTILGIRDEKDNSLITQQLVPLISMCRDKKQTLILLHHHRKQGGEYGEALSGGHALLGLVDRAIELTRDPNSPNRRIIKGVGRLIPVPEAVYELQDTDLVIIGSPKDLTLDAVKQEVHVVLLQLPGTMLTINAIREKMDEPKPSSEQARRALNELFFEKIIDRDPKENKAGKTYKYGVPDENNNLLHSPLSIGGGKVEEEEQGEQLSVEQIKDMFDAGEVPPSAPF